MLDMFETFWRYTADTWAVLGGLFLIVIVWMVAECLFAPPSTPAKGIKLMGNRIEKYPGSIWKEGRREVYWKLSFICSCGNYCKLILTEKQSYYRCENCHRYYSLKIMDGHFVDKVEIEKPESYKEIVNNQRKGKDGITRIERQ